MAQHQRHTGPSSQNTAAPFSPDMTAGQIPDRPRLQLGARIPLPLTQPVTVVVTSPFSAEMVVGRAPAPQVPFVRPRVGWTWTEQIIVAMTPEQFGGWHPDRPCLLKATRGASDFPWSGTPAPFTPEMVAGWHPDTARVWLAPHLPLPGSEVTPAQAPVSPDMVAGWVPDRPVLARASRPGWLWAQTTFSLFSIEMAQGVHPDTSRAFLAPRIGLPLSQAPTPVLPFSVEMTAGLHPDQPRLWLAPRIPLPLSQTAPTAAPFSTEMVAGWHPDQPRPFVPAKAGWIQAQTTPVAAPFSMEMVQGSQPSTGRAWLPLRTGLAGWVSDLLIFSIEMVAGWHPDQKRERLGPKIPLPVSETTPTAAPFSVEMAQGSQPTAPRPPFRAALGWIGDIVGTIVVHLTGTTRRRMFRKAGGRGSSDQL